METQTHQTLLPEIITVSHFALGKKEKKKKRETIQSQNSPFLSFL